MIAQKSESSLGFGYKGLMQECYMLLEFQRINKQMTAKRNVDYFQRVCDATIMHVTCTFEAQEAPTIY